MIARVVRFDVHDHVADARPFRLDLRADMLGDAMGVHPAEQLLGGKRLGRIPRLAEMRMHIDVVAGGERLLGRQSESLAAAWRRRGLPVEVIDMAGHDHFSIVTELGQPGTPLARAILGQIEAVRAAAGRVAR